MLTIAESTPHEQSSKALRSMNPRNMRIRHDPGDMDGAVIAAAKRAAQAGRSYFVYAGNSYMHRVYRATYKRGEAFDPINNTGRRVIEVTPSLNVIEHKLDR